MTLADLATPDPQAFLPPEPPQFPQVLALPERTRVPEGELYSFRFANGYGALVVRPLGVFPPHAAAEAFELCVLDWTGPAPQPTFVTPVGGVQTGLSHEQTAQLLARTEHLPRHPALARADETFGNEEF